jgi:hypothetical protein
MNMEELYKLIDDAGGERIPIRTISPEELRGLQLPEFWLTATADEEIKDGC